jgi:hypothetical protein
MPLSARAELAERPEIDERGFDEKVRDARRRFDELET